MALQTKILQATGSTGHHYFTLTVKEDKVDQAANTSTLSWDFRLTPKQNYWDWYGWGNNIKFTVNINGSEYSGTIPSYDGVSEEILATSEDYGNLVIKHNSNGQKSISVSFSVNSSGNSANYLPGTASKSETMTLTTIPRFASIDYAPIEWTDIENPTIEYVNPMGSNIDGLEAWISWTGFGDIKRTLDPNGNSVTFTLTAAEKKAILQAANMGSAYMQVDFVIWSKIGNIEHKDYITSEFEVTDCEPTLSPNVYDNGTVSKTLTGDSSKVIKGYNTIYVYSGAVAKKEAYITSQKVTCNGKTYDFTNKEYAILDSVESATFLIEIEDSRGKRAKQTVNLTLLPYVKPTITLEAEGELDAATNTVTVTLTANGVGYEGSFGAVTNEVVIQRRYKTNNGDYGEWVGMGNVTIKSDNTYTFTAPVAALDYQGTYIFQCRIKDNIYKDGFLSEERTIKIIPVFDWSKEDFNFNVPVSFQGDTMADFIIETSTAAMGSNGTWYIEKWKSGKAVCYGTRNYGNMSVEDGISNTFRQSYPSGLFIQRPDIVHIQVAYHEEEFWAYIGKAYGGYGSKTQTEEFCVLVNGEWTGTLPQTYISFNIIGRWK